MNNVPNLEARGVLFEFRCELIIDATLNVDTGTGTAGLAVVEADN